MLKVFIMNNDKPWVIGVGWCKISVWMKDFGVGVASSKLSLSGLLGLHKP